MTGFDAVLAIDWSGARRAGGIAVAEFEPRARVARLLPPPRGGAWRRAEVRDLLLRRATRGPRTLAGMDFAFAWPRALTEAWAAGRAPAAGPRAFWSEIEAESRDQPDLYAGAVLDHPALAGRFWRRGTREEQRGAGREPFALPLRRTEQVCKEAGLGHPESVVKLIGSKQVGMASLSGMRLLHALGRHDRIAIWPFDVPGGSPDGATLVVAEIFPRIFLRRAGLGDRKLAEAGAARALLRAQDVTLEAHGAFGGDEGDALLSAIALNEAWASRPALPPDPDPIAEDPVAEGWILGVPWPTEPGAGSEATP